jgi:hypothetical protein
VGTRAEQEPAFEEEQMRQRDIRAVQNALYRYKKEPLVPENELLDLVQWWDVSKRTYVHRHCVRSH